LAAKIEKEEVAPHDIKDLESDTVEAANRISTKEPAKEPTKGDVSASAKAPHKAMFTPDELKKLGALLCLFVFNALFWSIYEQGGSSLNIFADRLTNNTLFGMSFPSSWFQSLQSTYVILLAPVFSWLWIKLGEKQPSSPGKFSLGLLFLGIGIAVHGTSSDTNGSGQGQPHLLNCCLLRRNPWRAVPQPSRLKHSYKARPCQASQPDYGRLVRFDSDRQ
jgi:hypothetical protein